MKFFLDNNLSPKLAEGMRAFGEDVIHLKDQFSEDVADIVWLEHIGKEGILLITRDQSIRYNPVEIGALRRFKVSDTLLPN